MDYYNDNKLLGRNLFWWKSLFITFDLIDSLLFKSTNVNKSLQFRAKTYQIIPLLGCKRGIIAEMRALRHITGPAPVYPQVNGAGLSPVISSTNRPQLGAREPRQRMQRLGARGVANPSSDGHCPLLDAPCHCRDFGALAVTQPAACCLRTASLAKCEDANR